MHAACRSMCQTSGHIDEGIADIVASLDICSNWECWSRAAAIYKLRKAGDDAAGAAAVRPCPLVIYEHACSLCIHNSTQKKHSIPHISIRIAIGISAQQLQQQQLTSAKDHTLLLIRSSFGAASSHVSASQYLARHAIHTPWCCCTSRCGFSPSSSVAPAQAALSPRAAHLSGLCWRAAPRARIRSLHPPPLLPLNAATQPRTTLSPPPPPTHPQQQQS